ncbi:MAG: trimethylamine methyltransferase family protein [Bacillota bacterium]|nr:hypothetical protein [Clostridia bacterium]
MEDDNEDYGFSVIKRVIAEKGDFITDEHTLQYLYSPELWNRSNYSGNSRAYAGWKEHGAKNYLDLIEEKVKGILKEHQVIPLDPKVEKELSALVRLGEKDLKED